LFPFLGEEAGERKRGEVVVVLVLVDVDRGGNLGLDEEDDVLEMYMDEVNDDGTRSGAEEDETGELGSVSPPVLSRLPLPLEADVGKGTGILTRGVSSPSFLLSFLENVLSFKTSSELTLSFDPFSFTTPFLFSVSFSFSLAFLNFSLAAAASTAALLGCKPGPTPTFALEAFGEFLGEFRGEWRGEGEIEEEADEERDPVGDLLGEGRGNNSFSSSSAIGDDFRGDIIIIPLLLLLLRCGEWKDVSLIEESAERSRSWLDLNTGRVE
jgi:hypothetical protein